METIFLYPSGFPVLRGWGVSQSPGPQFKMSQKALESGWGVRGLVKPHLAFRFLVGGFPLALGGLLRCWVRCQVKDPA